MRKRAPRGAQAPMRRYHPTTQDARDARYDVDKRDTRFALSDMPCAHDALLCDDALRKEKMSDDAASI